MKNVELIVCASAVMALSSCGGEKFEQPEIGARKVDVLTVDGYQFKDLNKNGELDVYEDWRQPQDARIADLVSQMTLEEKAGLMFHPNIAVKEDGKIKYDLTDEEKEALAKQEEGNYAGPIGPGGQNRNNGMAMGQMRREATAKSFIEEKGFRNILNNGVAAPKLFAEWSNGMQEIAEASRLGIPIMFSSDPRHSAKLGGHVSGTQYFSHMTNGEGQVGITASRDKELIKKFGEVMAEEYRAVGLHMFLGPQIDVMTEPRWSRNMGCFSEDANLTAEMSDALIEGAQGDHVGPNKILVHLKHWPGSGPHLDGQGRWLVYPSDNQEYHYTPWRSGIKKGALAAMGYYSGTYSDSLNVNYSYHLSTEVLKQEMGFQGAICTDWGVAGNGPLKPSIQGTTTLKDNYAMIFNAGVDQIGSETHPEYVVELVNEGRLPIERVNDAVSRILKWHFSLGLFENPYVDPEKAEQILQSEKNEAIGMQCQLAANILLTNDGTLPLKEGTKVYVEGIAPEVAANYATVVETPEAADVIIYRTTTALDRRGFRPAPGTPPAEVNIDFPAEKMEVMKKLASYGKPLVANLNPTGSSNVITDELKNMPNAILLSFDPTDDVVCKVLFGKHNPNGKLPYEIPSSMDAVRKQLEDKPFDSEKPQFEFGFGLSY